MEPVYLFSVNPSTPPALEIDSGEEVKLVVRGAFADVPDIRDVPTPFTPACDGHPLAPIAGPILVRGAEPGDAVTIELLEFFASYAEEFAEEFLSSLPGSDPLRSRLPNLLIIGYIIRILEERVD